MVMPGKYKVTVAKVIDNMVITLGESQEFEVKVLANTTLPATDRQALVQFQRQVAELTRVLQGSMELIGELNTKLVRIKQTLVPMPKGAATLLGQVAAMEKELDDIIYLIRGLEPKASEEEIPPTHMPLWSRLSTIIYNQFSSTANPGKNQTDGCKIVKEELAPLLLRLKKIANEDLPKLEKELGRRQCPLDTGQAAGTAIVKILEKQGQPANLSLCLIFQLSADLFQNHLFLPGDFAGLFTVHLGGSG